MSKLYVDIRNILNLDVAIKSPVKSRAIGRYKSVFKGKGLEFEGFRTYSEGDDDASLIDWKASTRANDLLTREFVEERDLNVFFLIDVGGSMKYGSVSKLKGEYAAEVALSLAHTVLQSGDAVGFCLHGEGDRCKFPFIKGPNQFYIFSENITNPKFYGGAFNFNNAVDFLVNFARTGDLVFIISDFINLKGNWKSSVDILAEKFEVIAVMIRDIRDSKLPVKGELVNIEDPVTGRQMTFHSDDIKSEYESYAKKQERSVEAAFVKNGQGFIKLYTNKPFVEPITNFFSLRHRTWR